MINFCHGFLKPVITCDKVCADEHGVENLISGVDYWASQRGFRAERFIMPPVSVTVRFPCHIQVARILLDPVVGRQKSCGFEIYASTKTHRSSWSSNTNGPPAISEEEIFRPFGKEILREPCVVCFENPLYRPRSPFDTFREEGIRGCKKSILRGQRAASLSSVSAVTIRIVSTVERSAPALKRLEVWGQPALSCPSHIQTTIYQLFREALIASSSRMSQLEGVSLSTNQNPEPRTSATDVSSVVTISCSGSHLTTDQSSVDIPEDFIDPITCDIMTVPLTLPSGKTIDQLTLDKHVQAESQWGRPPSDPFTGVPFCVLKKPVPNVSLKLRIDRFVLNHSAELTSVPRVLGRGDKSPRTTPLTSVKQQREADSRPTQPPTTISSAPGTNSHYTCSKDNKAKVKRKHDQSCSGVELQKSKVVKLEVSNCAAQNSDNVAKSHEANLSQSLDAALYAALGGLPSFQTIKPTNETCPSDSNLSSIAHIYTCVFCNKSPVSNTFYTLPCDHFTCRNCLTQTLDASSQGKCEGCGKRFFSKDIVRLNI